MEPKGRNRKIRIDFHKWRSRVTIGGPVPSGWTMKYHQILSIYYTVAVAPGPPFQYPLPTTAELAPKPEQLSWPPYLQFCALHAYFTILEAPSDSNVRLGEVLVSDSMGGAVSTLKLNVWKKGDTTIGEQCEPIAISKGRSAKRVRNICGTGPPYMDVTVQNDGRQDFYNVFWIKREGRYMVREAVGRVDRSAWDRQALEKIEVELH